MDKMNRMLELVILQEEVQSELRLKEIEYSKAKDFNVRYHLINRITELSKLSNELAAEIFKESHSSLKELMNA